MKKTQNHCSKPIFSLQATQEAFQIAHMVLEGSVPRSVSLWPLPTIHGHIDTRWRCRINHNSSFTEKAQTRNAYSPLIVFNGSEQHRRTRAGATAFWCERARFIFTLIVKLDAGCWRGCDQLHNAEMRNKFFHGATNAGTTSQVHCSFDNNAHWER